MTDPIDPTPKPVPEAAENPVRVDAERERLADRFPHVLEAYRAAGASIPELASPGRVA